MKDLATGKRSGPPLEHDAWIDRQKKIEQTEIDAMSSKSLEVDDEPVFAGHPLSFYVDKSDDEIRDIKGVGPKVFDEIKAAIDAHN